MNTVTTNPGVDVNADWALLMSAKVWFALAMTGQLFFAIYIGARYGLALFVGEAAQMNLSPHITGYVEGDVSGNSMMYMHIAGAALISACGILQLVPALRQKYPLLHRLNGRMFLTLGLLGATTGLYLTWLRGTRITDIGALGISINGVLILIAIYYTWRYAITRQFALHQRWAVHTFFLVNAVWTLRLFLMGWYLVTQGGYGNNRTMDGPADMAISFACYLLPMALAELYFWAHKQREQSRKWIVFGLMCIGCLGMFICVAATIYMMWIPRIGTAIDAVS